MKSHESDLLEVASCLLRDVDALCTAGNHLRDFETMKSRVESEGLSFLTITLPTFGSDLETALEHKCVTSDLFRSFKKRQRIPAFLQGVLSSIFDATTGRILDEPSIEAIAGARQICYAFKKVKIECTHERYVGALNKFIQDELVFDADLDPCDVEKFVNVSNCLWANIFSSFDDNTIDYTPKHGPGATAERYSANGRYRMKRWHERLEPFFPYYPFVSNLSSAAACEGLPGLEEVTFVSSSEEQPVRVQAVPKTLKTPRIIAIEPACMQYAQQAIAARLTDLLQSVNPTRGHINFKDQSVNRQLALTSSRTGRYATIDLSAASDRVALSLAMRMFDSKPDLQAAIFACRSRKAQVEIDGRQYVVNLKKFASMGSAMCFPVESMLFYTICIVGLLEDASLPVTFRNVCKVARDVYVYGDDIIVPADKAEVVMNTLECYYLKVNMTKSFWKSKFRESCGMDAYDGHEVTPIYVRQTRPHHKDDSPQLISWVATSNLLYQKGYWNAASHMMKACESIIGTLPIVGPKCAGLGKVSFQRYVSTQRWGRRYQRNEVRTLVPCSVYREDKLDGYPALHKCLLRLTLRDEGRLEPIIYGSGAGLLSPTTIDEKHLRRTPRHGAVALKRRWVSPY